MSRPDCDVLIVGAGPVGQITASLLAQRDVSVIVLERQPQPYPLPRAVALAHDVVRVLYSLGLGADLDDLLEPWGQDGQLCVLENSAGERLSSSVAASDSISGYPIMSAFSQPDLETALERSIDANPLVSQRRGHTVRSLHDDGSLVQVSATDTTGREITFTARYVVGCDGANSVVRDHMDARLQDLEFDREWLVVDVVPNGPLSGTMRDMGQRLAPGRPTTFVPAGPNRRRFEFMMQPGDDYALLDTEAGAWNLLEPWGYTSSNSSLTRQARYTFRARWAEQWRAGRLLMAGDAAHQMPPFLGQGLNSGIRDATSLAWRLSLIVRGLGSEQLLDDYVAERRDQSQTIIRETVGMGQIICMTDPDEAAQRDEFIKANNELVAAGLRTTWPLSEGTIRDQPGAGDLALQARVHFDGRTGRLDDVVKPGAFMLVGSDGDPLRALRSDVRSLWDELGGTVLHFGPDGCTDVDGDYGRWFQTLDAQVILVRPDFHIFGTASGDSEAVNALVTDLLTGIRQHRVTA